MNRCIDRQPDTQTDPPPPGLQKTTTNLQATIYNNFASLVYIVQPKLGPNINLQCNQTPPKGSPIFCILISASTDGGPRSQVCTR